MKKSFFVILLFFVSSGFSQEEESDPYALFFPYTEITTGTKTEIPFDEAPGTVSVITEKEIELYGLHTLIDVYKILPGFEIYMSEHNEWIPSVRGSGAGSALIKLMINGHPVNEIVWRGTMSWMDFSLKDVKQIEVIRGPGSALYGTDAFLGVINLIIKEEGSNVIEGTFGEFGRYGGHISSFNTTEKFSYNLFFDYLREKGESHFFESDFMSPSLLTETPIYHKRKKQRKGVFIDANYENLKIQLHYADNEQLWIEGVGNILVSDPPKMINEYGYLELEYLINLDYFDLILKTAYDNNSNTFSGMWLPKGFTWGRDINSDGVFDIWPEGAFAETIGVKAESYDFEFLVKKQFFSHHLILGFQHRVDDITDVPTVTNIHPHFMYKSDMRKWVDPEDQFITGKGKKEKFNAFYFQWIQKINNFGSIVYGLRYDDYSIGGTSTNPRCAVVWNVTDHQILKFTYSEAFFSPYAMARYANVSFWGDNPDIAPQTIKNYEIALQNSYESNFFYNLTFFYNRIFDTIESNIVLDPAFSNTGNISAKGIETDGRLNLPFNLFFWWNLSLSDSEHRLYKTRPSYAVEKVANIGITYQSPGNIALSIHWHYSDEIARFPTIAIAGDDSADGRKEINLNLVCHAIQGVEFSLLIKNLLDNKYYYPNNTINLTKTGYGSDYPGEGRQIILKASKFF